MSRVEQLIFAVNKAIELSNRNILPEEIVNYQGYSVLPFRNFLNALLTESVVENYLEVGVWYGSTAISALYNNHHRVNHWFIDNWSEFGGPKDRFVTEFTRLVGKSPNIINDDCFSINPVEMNIKDVDVYFYDGGHEEVDQYRAVTHFYECMKDSFILIVDDWNWKDRVEHGTLRGIEAKNIRIERQWTESWWNGVGIFVLSKQQET